MSREKEFNSHIEQQLNGIAINNKANEIAEKETDHNIEKINMLKAENSLYNNGIELRNTQNIAIRKNIAAFKKLVRDGEYGNEFKDMKFIDD